MNKTLQGKYAERLEKEKHELQHKIIDLRQSKEELQEKIDKIKEYGENCLENLKDQDDFINESVNVVALLKMIHQNYLEILGDKE